MDSEGLGGVDKNQNYDIKIFTLALLLSSFLIYVTLLTEVFSIGFRVRIVVFIVCVFEI